MIKLEIGDVLTLKKGHPCGENSWEVIRIGSDIKLKCLGCERVVMIDRPTLVKRIRKIDKQN